MINMTRHSGNKPHRSILQINQK